MPKQSVNFVGKQKSEEKAHAELLAEAQKIKAKLKKRSNCCSIHGKIGPDGRTFGSITNKKRLQKSLRNNLALKLINVISKFPLQFVQQV